MLKKENLGSFFVYKIIVVKKQARKLFNTVFILSFQPPNIP